MRNLRSTINKILKDIKCLKCAVKELIEGGTGGDGIQSIQEGTNITVDNTDPSSPIINAITPTLQQVTTAGNTSNKDIELAYSANQKTSIKSYGNIDLQSSIGKAALNSQGLTIYQNASSTNAYTFNYSKFSFNTSSGAVTYHLPTQADYNSTSINNIAIVGRKPVKTISTATYSLVYNDRNNILLFTHPAGCTITVSSSDLASTRTNNHYYGLQLGGKLTFTPQAGITLTGSTETLGVGCRFEINFIANENFHISVTPTKEWVLANSNISANDVRSFGAVGNGVTDDTVAIQAALDSAHKEIIFPAGFTFLVDGGVEDNVGFRTIHANGSTIKLKDNASVDKVILRVNADFTTILGGTWDGNKTNGNATGDTYSNSGISLYADNCVVRDAWLKDSSDIGIKGNGSYNECINNRITGTTHYGIFFDADDSTIYVGNKALSNKIDMSSATGEGQGILFTSSESTGGDQQDWEISYNYVIGDNSPGVLDQAINLNCRGTNGKVIGNNTKYGSMGWSEGGDGTLIQGNNFHDLAATGIGYGIEPSGKQIIIGNTITGAKTGIIVSDYYFDKGIISNNVIQSTVAGIEIAPSVGKSANYAVIIGNTITSYDPIVLIRETIGMAIKGNTLMGTNSARSGITADSITQPCYLNVVGNTFYNLHAPVRLYAGSALAYQNVYVSDTTTIGMNLDRATSFYLDGSATLGANCKIVNHSERNVNVLDAQNNIVDYTVGWYSDPNGDIAAGVGSTYKGTSGGGYYFKQTGTGNTGWVKIDP